MKKKRTPQFGSFSLQLVFCSAAVCSMITGTLLAFFHPEAPTKSSHPAAAGLTFAERVAYQRAIEEVYWHHRIWPRSRGERPDPKPSLDAVMSQAQLEKKVADYLRNSQALEDYWHRPLTAEQLQVEMDRMAQHTKRPEVLRELFEALGNDPVIIAECLARPALVARLMKKSYDRARSVGLGGARAQYRVRNAMVGASANSTAQNTEEPSGCVDNWAATSLTNAPSARNYHTAVWTGSEMIIWGGWDGPALNTGGRYDPTTDSWTAISTASAPTARLIHTAVWTGSEMIVWGGFDNMPRYTNTGGRYNPVTDSSTATSTTNAPTARAGGRPVWTGSGGDHLGWGE